MHIKLTCSSSFGNVGGFKGSNFNGPVLHQGALLEKFKENDLRKIGFLKLLTKENLLACFH